MVCKMRSCLNEKGIQVQRLMAGLDKHSDLVAEALWHDAVAGRGAYVDHETRFRDEFTFNAIG